MSKIVDKLLNAKELLVVVVVGMVRVKGWRLEGEAGRKLLELCCGCGATVSQSPPVEQENG